MSKGEWEVEKFHDSVHYIGGEVRELSKDILVRMYLSLDDGQPVIEVETGEHTGEIRVYVNDGKIFGRDPEGDDDE